MMPKPYRLMLGGLLLGTVFGLLLAPPVQADFESGWRLRFYAAAINFDESSDGRNRLPGGWGYDIDIGAGLGVNAEYRFSRRLGFDMGVIGGAGVDIEARTFRVGSVSGVVYDTVTYTPLTAGLDIHLTPDRRVDLYACPMVALVTYGGLRVQTGVAGTTTRVGFDKDFALGGALGLGVPFGKGRWSFHANLAYLDASMNGNGQNGLEVRSDHDATIMGLGLGYRF